MLEDEGGVGSVAAFFLKSSGGGWVQTACCGMTMAEDDGCGWELHGRVGGGTDKDILLSISDTRVL